MLMVAAKNVDHVFTRKKVVHNGKENNRKKLKLHEEIIMLDSLETLYTSSHLLPFLTVFQKKILFSRMILGKS